MLPKLDHLLNFLQCLSRKFCLAILGPPGFGDNIDAGAHSAPGGRPVGVRAPEGVFAVKGSVGDESVL